MGTSTRTPDGREKICISKIPTDNLHTVFTGEGDNSVAIFAKLSSTDSYQEVTIYFSEISWISSGCLWCSDTTPFGATADISVVNPIDDSIIARYCRKVPLTPGKNSFSAEDAAEIPAGVYIRLTVYNSPGTGIFDPPAEIKVSGVLQMYKATVT